MCRNGFLFEFDTEVPDVSQLVLVDVLQCIEVGSFSDSKRIALFLWGSLCDGILQLLAMLELLGEHVVEQPYC
jgi:hypothetical protein